MPRDLFLIEIDLHKAVEQRQRILTRPLEAVAADDRAVAAAIADRAGVVENGILVLMRTAREHHDSAAVEARLHDVAYPLRQGADRDLALLIDLLGLGVLQIVGR